MANFAIKMESVYKKFRRGEVHDSLRDLVPSIFGKVFRRTSSLDMKKQEFWALQDVSFEVDKGEAFGIIGHNGAGKSTMLKILSRIMKPTTGELIVQGRLSALIEVSAGFHPDLTGRENIYLNGTILGMTRREIGDKLDAIIDFSGLQEFIDTPVKRYSSGMYARLGFSVAAHVEPEIMLVDEVLSVGDYVFQQKCIARMNEVISGGATVLFVSHNLRAVAELCQRSLLLKNGKVQAIGKTNEIITKYMESTRNINEEDPRKILQITSVAMRDFNGPQVQFQLGDKAWLDITVRGVQPCEKFAVCIYINDENYYNLFNTSSERLGHGPYNIRTGETLRISFELLIGMAQGTYHMGVLLFRYDTNVAFDRWEPAVTFYVGTSIDGSRGIVPCNPKVVSEEIAGEMH